MGLGRFYLDVVFVLCQPGILEALCTEKKSELSVGMIPLPRGKKITQNLWKLRSRGLENQDGQALVASLEGGMGEATGKGWGRGLHRCGF